MRRVLGLLLLLLVGATTGCAPIRYVTQAAAGQEKLNEGGISVQEVVEGNHLDKRTRELLANVSRIKAFGERVGLKRTKSYERYKWIGRPAVVWVVSACDPLHFRPVAWHFPIVGSITYTGWFDEQEAKSYAAEFAAKGLDVDVRPSPAYSTLGWFDDPILSTMLATGDDALGELADVILHETLHATFYVQSQSTLNESMASFVGDTLAVQYMEEVLGPDTPAKKSFLDLRVRGEARGKRMKIAYHDLETVYSSRTMTREEKLAEKARILEELRVETKARRVLNNASLIQYKTYGSGKEEMAALYEQCGRSMPRMLADLEGIREIARTAPPHSDPALLLKPLLAKGCP